LEKQERAKLDDAIKAAATTVVTAAVEPLTPRNKKEQIQNIAAVTSADEIAEALYSMDLDLGDEELGVHALDITDAMVVRSAKGAGFHDDHAKLGTHELLSQVMRCDELRAANERLTKELQSWRASTGLKRMPRSTD
jgi:hypothetical protein